MTAPAFIARNLAEAGAALAAAATARAPVTLVSAGSAAGYAGPGYFKAMIAAAAAAAPEVAVTAFLDCGSSPGLVLAALREGVSGVIFSGSPTVTAKLEAIARTQGAKLLTERPAAIDIAALRRHERHWAAALRQAFADAGAGG